MVNWFARIMITSIVSVSIAVGLSYLSSANVLNLNLGKHLAVSGNIRSMELSKQNMVDFLTAMPLHLTLKRVDWSNNDLLIDMVSEQQKENSNYIYEDLYELVRNSFIRASNVAQLQVRVLGASGNKEWLLMAMDAHKSELSKESLQQLADQGNGSKSFLRSNFGLTYTQIWKDIFGTE